MTKEQIRKQIDDKKQNFLSSYCDKHKFLEHTFNGSITSVTRKSDSKTFKLGDEIYNTSSGSYGAKHKIMSFKIQQRQFSRLLEDYSGIDEIWVNYDKDSGGEWLCNIDFYSNKHKPSVLKRIKNWIFKHIAQECPPHLDDLF